MHAKYVMSNASTKGIQRALNPIRSELDDANQQAQLEVLQLMLASSQSIVAAARKLDKANGKKKQKAMPTSGSNKPAQPKPDHAQQLSIKYPVSPRDQQAIQPKSPVKPLPPKR
jgi:GTP-binding protein EngB required for normal cell division